MYQYILLASYLLRKCGACDGSVCLYTSVEMSVRVQRGIHRHLDTRNKTARAVGLVRVPDESTSSHLESALLKSKVSNSVNAKEVTSCDRVI